MMIGGFCRCAVEAKEKTMSIANHYTLVEIAKAATAGGLDPDRIGDTFDAILGELRQPRLDPPSRDSMARDMMLALHNNMAVDRSLLDCVNGEAAVSGRGQVEVVAEYAYRQADAMIQARAR
jgi:hypothetical protein